jgi:hypothetical protein
MALFSPLLTKDERTSLDKEGRVALRRKRRLEKWPDTDGQPPWKAKAEKALADLAEEAVKWAAREILGNGQDRHIAAVARLMTRAGLGGPFAMSAASMAIGVAFELVIDLLDADDEGELE